MGMAEAMRSSSSYASCTCGQSSVSLCRSSSGEKVNPPAPPLAPPTTQPSKLYSSKLLAGTSHRLQPPGTKADEAHQLAFPRS